jgi:adenylate kinase
MRRMEKAGKIKGLGNVKKPEKQEEKRQQGKAAGLARKPKVVLVTGTPGTGKTTLAKMLAKKLAMKYIDVNQIIKERGLSEGYDAKRAAKIVDTKKLGKAMLAEIEMLKAELADWAGKAGKGSKSGKPDKPDKPDKPVSGVIIDSHLSHYLPARAADACIITKCSLKTLKRRLEKRGYSEAKVRENLDAEIFDVCFSEAKEAGHNVIVWDTEPKNRAGQIKTYKYLVALLV